jgi:7,8-dihydropterin-6-yl-methyl-4-(beta-D-ribofuranosyl)aminobenzene 5'-phosphate synthase
MRRNILPLLLLIAPLVAAQPVPDHRVKSLKIRVLSTMLTADEGIGEWGFSALVEVDGRRILFDTGARPDTVLNNVKDLGVDLTNITDVILSHNHRDHTGGLMTLRRAMLEKNPASLSRAHVGQGIFAARRLDQGTVSEFMSRTRSEYEATGGHVVEYDKPAELWNGVWLTGPVPRKYPERNFGRHSEIQTADGWKEDTIPEDMSMVFNTSQGLVVLSGCGHSGIINTLDYTRSAIRNAPIHAAVGGWEIYSARIALESKQYIGFVNWPAWIAAPVQLAPWELYLNLARGSIQGRSRDRLWVVGCRKNFSHNPPPTTYYNA